LQEYWLTMGMALLLRRKRSRKWQNRQSLSSLSLKLLSIVVVLSFSTSLNILFVLQYWLRLFNYFTRLTHGIYIRIYITFLAWHRILAQISETLIGWQYDVCRKNFILMIFFDVTVKFYWQKQLVGILVTYSTGIGWFSYDYGLRRYGILWWPLMFNRRL